MRGASALARVSARALLWLALTCAAAATGCPDPGAATSTPPPPPGTGDPGAAPAGLAAAQTRPEAPPEPSADPAAGAGDPRPSAESPPSDSTPEEEAERPAPLPDPWDVPEGDAGAGDDAAAEDPQREEEERTHRLWEQTAGPGAVDKFPGIRIYINERRLEVRGLICLRRCPTLEFAGCTSRGKTHESLVLFDCDPKQLHLALIMLGLTPTPQVTEFGQQVALDKGDKVVIEVAWEASAAPDDPTAPPAVDGLVRRRLEDLIYDRRTRLAMPRVGWVFTGSRMVKVPAPPDWKELHEVYAAAYDGNLVAVYHDPNAILDTPLAEGGDDTVYVPFTERLPERGTEIVIHLRPWAADDGPSGGGEAPASDEQGPDEQGPDEQGPDEQGPDEQGPDEQAPDEQAPDEQEPDGSQ